MPDRIGFRRHFQQLSTSAPAREGGCGGEDAEVALAQMMGADVIVSAGASHVFAPYADDADYITAFSPARRAEFASGRACARAALRRLTGLVHHIPRAADRTPVWPQGVVGAISHTAGLTCAVVGWRNTWAGLGVDVEDSRPLPTGAAPWIGDEAELGACRAAGLDPKVLLCAKEAAFKCWPASPGRPAGFRDAAIALQRFGPRHGTFRITVGGGGGATADAMKGVWRVDKRFTYAGALLPARLR